MARKQYMRLRAFSSNQAWQNKRKRKGEKKAMEKKEPSGQDPWGKKSFQKVVLNLLSLEALRQQPGVYDK